MLRAVASLIFFAAFLLPIARSETALQILAEHCFECHGPDEETVKGDLRLDTFQGAHASTVIAGHPERSEIIARMRSTDPEERMPPAKHHEPMTEADIAKIEQWIRDGAPYEEHWAFIPPKRPRVPNVKGAVHPVDAFVRERLAQEGVKPAPPADRATLARRLHLDLIGLPPTPAEAEAFISDPSPFATERLVDRLLSSPHYGERWARVWLDLARYSDTHGYEKDRERSIWPYRDWVIKALNDDMPFAQFTLEQLAGDMLPSPTLSQRVATGFHRNTMLNEEGGIDPLEYRYYAMVDRVATTGTTWLGLTIGCAQCHTHKYDPITHTDYFAMMGLLNNTEEPDLAVPNERHATALATHATQQTALENRLLADIDEAAFHTWLGQAKSQSRKWHPLEPFDMHAGLSRLDHEGEGIVFASGDGTKRDVYTLKVRLNTPASSLRLEVLPDARLPAGGPGRTFYEGREGDFFLSEFQIKPEGGEPLDFASASSSYGKINIGSGNANPQNVYDGNGSSGWSTGGQSGRANQLVLNLTAPLPAGVFEIEMLFERHFTSSLGKFRLSATDTPAVAKPWSADLEAQIHVGQTNRAIRLAFLHSVEASRKPLEDMRKRQPKPPMTMVFTERPDDFPRITHRHHRGEYLKPRERVPPGVPAIFPPLTGKANRLNFAHWLASEQNPLAARVAVNRAWHVLFGRGLVASVDDFGVLGDRPSHPELLDWLAVEFMARGGSMKQLHRLIVTSETYQQASVSRGTDDPHNVLLARGPRFRVDGEMVRDIALRASGVLHPAIGGPSVRPPQPASVTQLAYGGGGWRASTGPNRYRRSLYTHNKRTAPFAAYLVFDAPTGETCIARRNRSNTPLQALTLLNDEMFLEMLRPLAREAAEAKDPVSFLFRRFLTRAPDAKEHAMLQAFLTSQHQRIASGELNPIDICQSKQANPRWAALVLVARAILNLDETLTKS